jgi:hypothetical protein
MDRSLSGKGVRPMTRVKIEVSFDLPEGASREEAVSYVLDAVGSWCGSLRPDGWDGSESEGDPMFYLNKDSVRAATVIKGQRIRFL